MWSRFVASSFVAVALLSPSHAFAQEATVAEPWSMNRAACCLASP